MRTRTSGPAWALAILASSVLGAVVLPSPSGAVPMPVPGQGRAARLSIASPVTGNLVGGLVQVAVAFDAGSAGRVTGIELWVDDLLYSSQTVDLAEPRGTQTVEWDTLRLRNGQHGLKVRAFAGRRVIATDAAVVTVSNGGVDVVPPLVSFYSPLDGQTVSGNVNIGVNAADNDQVALVGLFVNRQLRMMKSQPPFQYTLDTTTLPLLNGRGALMLEAWAYDRAQNRGVAKPITVYVHNRINATPMQPDPKSSPGGGKTLPTSPSKTAATPSEPVVTKPETNQVARLSPLEALKAPIPAAPRVVEPGAAAVEPRATAPGPQAAPGPAPGKLIPPAGRVDVALKPKPSPAAPRGVPPPTSRPSRSQGIVRPQPSTPRLEAPLKTETGQPRPQEAAALPPSRTPGPRREKTVVTPAPVAPPPLKLARVPEGELVAVPRAPEPTAHPPALRPAAKPPESRSAPTAVKPAPTAPLKTVAPTSARPTAVLPAPATTRPSGPQQGSTPDRIVLPVYRLARMPVTPATSRGYTVQRGDTLPQIARRFGVTPRSILVANGLDRASDLTMGRRLAVPGTITIAYNDQPVDFDVQPRVEKGMAIAPFRQIFEHTGGIVRYQPTEHEVSAESPEKQVRIKIGSREALVNSAVILMDRAAFLDSGRTMVPVKFMTEALDLQAEYDVKTGAIYLIRK